MNHKLEDARKQLNVLRTLIVALCALCIGGYWYFTTTHVVRPEEAVVDFETASLPNREYFGDADPRKLYLDVMKFSLTDLI